MFKNKTVIITGASHGIGKALAIAFAREGAGVYLVARNKKNLQEISQRIKQEGNTVLGVFPLDATNYQEVEDVALKIAKVDILYNGIANYVEKPLNNVSMEQIEETIDFVYKTNVFVTKAFLPKLKRSKGVIINMVSDWGLPSSEEAPALFGSAKVAVGAFGDFLRREVRVDGIRVLNIYPTDVFSNTDIDDKTSQKGKIRLSDLIEAMLLLFTKEHQKTEHLVISCRGELLKVSYN